MLILEGIVVCFVRSRNRKRPYGEDAQQRVVELGNQRGATSLEDVNAARKRDNALQFSFESFGVDYAIFEDMQRVIQP